MDFFNIFFQSFHVGTSSNTAASRHDIRKTLRGFRDELHISANVGACLSLKGELAQEQERIRHLQRIEKNKTYKVYRQYPGQHEAEHIHIRKIAVSRAT